MDAAAAALILVVGFVTLGIGLYTRVRNLALGGAANVDTVLHALNQAKHQIETSDEYRRSS
jgi:hypothetical protein